MDCFSDFRERGLIHDTTDESAVRELVNRGGATVYAGFDPTADSLHVGSLVPLLCLARFQRHGIRPIVLAGGATGLVGDPSGKSEERNLLTNDVLKNNVECIKKQLSAFLDFEDKERGAILVDNADWLGRFGMLEFLRDIGKYFSVNYMVAKDSVKSRVQTREAGISFTEFSYMLLQAADFLHLYKEYGCNFQVGGSDQWGNITAGIELIRKSEGASSYGMTFPLITSAGGAKLGKTEKGAIWLDPERTSPFQLYQYYVRTDDRDVVAYLKFFTFLGLEEITALAAQVETVPERREAQKRLGLEMTTLLHGEDAARSALAASQLLYGGSVEDLSERDLLAAATDMDHSQADGPLPADGQHVVDLFVSAGMVKSRGEGKRLFQQGGMYVNNERCGQDSPIITSQQLLFERYLLLRSGKRNYHLLAFSR
jgi:tyrosyl-tRNA synthetase